MFRYRRRRFSRLALPIALVGLHLLSAEALAQKIKETLVYSPPILTLISEPKVVTLCDDQRSSSVVHLKARALSPNGYPIRYAWRTNGGRIEGEGTDVTWELSGLRPGSYRAYVDIDTGGDEQCQAFASTTVLVSKCAPPPPVCPAITITFPDNPLAGKPLDFSATVTGGSANVTRIYNWTVSAGTITSGQGTESIRVDTTGLAGGSVRASLSLVGFPMDCSATSVVQFPVPIECRRFDEFPAIARNDEKARLDNYAIDLQNDPTSTAQVIVYPGRQGRPGDVQKHVTRVLEYLVNSRGIDARRIVTRVGPMSGELMVELWICPQGSNPPNLMR